ncbi:MAG: exo-alpha-sialidase [Clostridia bacterium]|nr:exo-alpha-sialidase [Clostridia bacterium]
MGAKKIKLSEPVVIAQNTTEAILWGGWQLPDIRCDEEKNLFVKFHGRKDSIDTIGQDAKDPVYKSTDGGETWEISDKMSWMKAAPKLPNGDSFAFGEMPLIKGITSVPETGDNRALYYNPLAYTIDEINESGIARIEKQFKCYRVYAGSDEVKEETCNIKWDKMSVLYNVKGQYLYMISPTCGYRVDKNGVMWMTAYSAGFDEDNRLLTNKNCSNIFRSDDFGHNWEHVHTVVYKDEYNHPNSKAVEGFNETAMEILDDGTIFIVLRTGSIHPVDISTDENPMPMLYYVKSTDGGKTWTEPEKFYDYGVRPRSAKLPDGTVVFVSGRPGIYLRFCSDLKGEEWSEPQYIMTVPEDEKYNAYFEYSCYNTNLCVYDKNTIILAYSDFQRTAPDGKRAKSIMAVKITID